MNANVIGWDIGGAHLKAAALDQDGEVLWVKQTPCPLWQGLSHLETAVEELRNGLEMEDTHHAITLTGELVDLFPSRENGVVKILDTLTDRLGQTDVAVFAGPQGFVGPGQIKGDTANAAASANWLASALFTASRIESGLFVDIGSTTTDIVIISDKQARYRGYSDFERQRYDELVYTGVVRTPLMALARTVPFEGEWIAIMAEHFATSADVYRLCGELPVNADQMPAADDGEKTSLGSARRVARMLGLDFVSADLNQWCRLATYFRERQLGMIYSACQRQLSRGLLDASAPLIGAGVGRFLIEELARRLNRSYLDFTGLFPANPKNSAFAIADCAPAVAVARLLQDNGLAKSHGAREWRL